MVLLDGAEAKIGRQLFEKEQIQIKPWRETCDRAGLAQQTRSRSEGEKKRKRTKGVMGEEV